jgi:hypothetical protein
MAVHGRGNMQVMCCAVRVSMHYHGTPGEPLICEVCMSSHAGPVGVEEAPHPPFLAIMSDVKFQMLSRQCSHMPK